MMVSQSAACLLGIDAGTESVRVGLFDHCGRLLAKAAAPYSTSYPRSGWAEQDADHWWSALASAVRLCLTQSGIAAESIAGISADATTCTLLPLAANGQPLRPALLWMDVRATRQARRITETGHPALCYCPSGCSPEWMLSKALWLQQYEPHVFAKTAWFVEYLDWLMYRLTGRLALNLNTATQRWFYNPRAWGWPADLFAAVGLPDLASRIPPEVLAPGERVGSLTPEAAQALGLPAGIPVFEGGGDAFIALLGLNVTEPGKVGIIAGSSSVVATFTDEEVHGRGVFGGFPDAVIPGLWLVEGGQVSTGSTLAWFRDHLASDLPRDEAFAVLDREAAAIPPGAGGLIVLDYFQGNRTPYTDGRARGAVWGLSLHTTRAHIFRAMMEGIAYGTRHILEVFMNLGCEAKEVYVCGGGVTSEVFMGILADVCGIPLIVTKVPDAPLLGDAILAATGLGIYADLREAAQAMVRPVRTFAPGNHAAYEPYFDLYKQTYPRLRELMAMMATQQEHNSSS